MAADVTEYALETLRDTAAVTDLIVNGEDGIFEAGDLSMEYLAEVEALRRDNGTSTLLLALVVQDAGEKALDQTRHNQRAAVWCYDRQRGYANIRAVRKQVYLALQGKVASLDDPLLGRSVMVRLLFDDRTGYRHERVLAVDYETLTFASQVNLDIG